MREVLMPSRCGLSTVMVDGQAVHSRYDPALEAERYVDTLNALEGCDCILLVEPALGYLVVPLKRRFPGCRLIGLHCSDFYAHSRIVADYDASWHPGTGQALETFLELSVPQKAHCRIVEWRPAMQAYGRAVSDMVRVVADFLKREAANRATVAAFGKRWVANAFRNLRYADYFAQFSSGTGPVVVAAAGPGLEDSLPAIRAARRRCYLIAASSALEALAARDLQPDLVLGTDGGNWAKHHFQILSRRSGNVPVGAFNLVAAVPGAQLQSPAAFVADESAWQSILLSAAGCAALRLPQRGTVAATGVDLAFRLSAGPVYLAGFDMEAADMRTHARPHSFDILSDNSATRTSPVYDLKYRRFRAMREAGSLSVYAQWFKSRVGAYSQKVRVLGRAHPVFGDLPRTDHIEEHCGRKPAASVVPVAPDAARTAAKALLASLGNGAAGSAIAAELGELFNAADDPVPVLEGIIGKTLGSRDGEG